MTTYDGPDRRFTDQAVIDLREEVGQLKAGTLGLAEQVGTLSGALTAISVLQDKLTEVEDKSVTKDDMLQAAVFEHEEQLRFRKATLRRIYSAVLAMTLVLGVAAGVFVEYQHGRRQAAVDVCLKRVQQNNIILDVLRGVEDAVPAGSVQRFEALIVDCNKEVK